MSNPSLLSHNMQYSIKDLDLSGWHPITEKHVTDGMTVHNLCAAAIILSDNTAMNLLLKKIGGIQGMNNFARSIGNVSFRQDNDWPAEAYSGGDGNVKNTSTPHAMVESLHKITMGKVLDRPQRDLITMWLIEAQRIKH
jgi:beta-lactamase class A